MKQRPHPLITSSQPVHTCLRTHKLQELELDKTPRDREKIFFQGDTNMCLGVMATDDAANFDDMSTLNAWI
eukprot:1106836-Amphidinium_carterae.1